MIIHLAAVLLVFMMKAKGFIKKPLGVQVLYSQCNWCPEKYIGAAKPLVNRDRGNDLKD